MIAIQTRLLTELLGNVHVPKLNSTPKKKGANAKDYKVSAIATCIRLALTYEWMSLYLRGGSNPKFNDTLSNDDVKQQLDKAVRRYLFNDTAELTKKKNILHLAKNAIKNLIVSDKHASKGKGGVSNSVDKELKWFLTYTHRTTHDLPSRLEICQITFITNLLRKKDQYSDSKLAEFLYGNRVFHIRDGAASGNRESDPFEVHDDGVAPRRLNSPCDYVPTTNLANEQGYINLKDTYEAFFGAAGVDATVRATKIVTHATQVNANEPSTTGTENATIQESPAEDSTKRGAPANLNNAAEEGSKRAKTGNDIAAQADTPSDSASINDIAAQADTPSASASIAMMADESTVCTVTSSLETVSKGLKETFRSQGYAIDEESSKAAAKTFMQYIKEKEEITDMIGNDDNGDASFMETEDHDGDVNMLDIDVKGYYYVRDDHDLQLQDAVKRAYQYSKYILSKLGGGKVVLAKLKAEEIQTMYNWWKDTISNGTTVDMAIHDIANKLERNIKVITRSKKHLFEEKMYNVKDAKDTLFILRMDMAVNGNTSNENTRYTSLRKNPSNKEDSDVDVESSSVSLQNGTDHEGANWD